MRSTEPENFDTWWAVNRHFIKVDESTAKEIWQGAVDTINKGIMRETDISWSNREYLVDFILTYIRPQ